MPLFNIPVLASNTSAHAVDDNFLEARRLSKPRLCNPILLHYFCVNLYLDDAPAKPQTVAILDKNPVWVSSQETFLPALCLAHL